MINLVLSVLSWAFMAFGAFFVFAGAVGLWRFPDFYSRLNSAGVTDTLVALLIIVGLIMQAFVLLDLSAAFLIFVKLLIIGLFLFFTSPTATHAIANAAHTAGLKPFLGVAARRSVSPPPARKEQDED